VETDVRAPKKPGKIGILRTTQGGGPEVETEKDNKRNRLKKKKKKATGSEAAARDGKKRKRFKVARGEGPGTQGGSSKLRPV